jgi:hypothetical protein
MDIVKKNREIIKNIFLVIFENKYYQQDRQDQELDMTKEQMSFVNEIMYDMDIDDIEYVYSILDKLNVIELTDDVLYFKNGINGRKMSKIVDKIKEKMFQHNNQLPIAEKGQHQRIKILIKENNQLIKELLTNLSNT